VSPVKYELEFYIPEDGILHSHCRENLKSYIIYLDFQGFHVLVLWIVTPSNLVCRYSPLARAPCYHSHG
jgi:hypothetical protein